MVLHPGYGRPYSKGMTAHERPPQLPPIPSLASPVPRLPRGSVVGPLGLPLHPASGKPGKLIAKEGSLVLTWGGHSVICPLPLVGEAIGLGYLPPPVVSPCPTTADIRQALRSLLLRLPYEGQGREEERLCRGVLANVLDSLPE